MNVRWVQQKDTYGCGVAVLAMITGDEYDDVKRVIGEEFGQYGITVDTVDQYLFLRGYTTTRKYQFRFNKKRLSWPPAPFADVHVAQVLVSESSPGSHLVVMLRDGSVLDPLGEQSRRLSDYCRVYNMAAVVPITFADDEFSA